MVTGASDRAESASYSDRSRRSLSDRLARRIERAGLRARTRRLVAAASGRAVPRHWTSFIGAAAVGCVIVLFVTGLLLMLFYRPSAELVQYRGSYSLLTGVTMSRAYESVVGISLDVRGGLLLRQAHHWAALLLPAILIVQLAAVGFTGRNRRPRRVAWLLLCAVLLAVLLGGWSGYALPDDMLSGSGLRIFQGTLLAIPVVGTALTGLVFGSGFPGHVLPFLYVVHVVAAPAALLLALGVRAAVLWRLPGSRRPAVGLSNRPIGLMDVRSAAPRAAGLAIMTAGFTVLLGATVTVAPVWITGPSDPGSATAGSQPDWYTAFLDGALRLVPPGWEVVVGDRTLTLAVLVPVAVVGALVAAVVVVPAIEDWFLHDRAVHLALRRPRDMPVRTGLGVGVVVLYLVLSSAAASDVTAHQLRLGLEQVIEAHRVALLVGPPIGFVTARAVCLALRRKDEDLVQHGVETGRLVRLPGGEYIEVHKPLDEERRSALVEALGSRDTRIARAALLLRSPLWLAAKDPPVPPAAAVGRPQTARTADVAAGTDR